jgi:hypothetical protein
MVTVLAAMEYLEWGGSPWGGSTIERWAGCAKQFTDDIPYVFPSRVPVLVGGAAHLWGAHLVWFDKDFDQKRCVRLIREGFREWEAAGLKHDDMKLGVNLKRKNLKLMDPTEGRLFLQHHDDITMRLLKWTEQAKSFALNMVTALRSAGLTPIAVEMPICSKRRYKFRVATLTGYTEFESPVTSVADVLCVDRRGQIVMVDYKTTGIFSKADSMSAAAAEVNELQAAVHLEICAERGWTYKRIYVHHRYPYIQDALYWTTPQADLMRHWLRNGPIAPYQAPSYKNCGDCQGTVGCWGTGMEKPELDKEDRKQARKAKLKAGETKKSKKTKKK